MGAAGEVDRDPFRHRRTAGGHRRAGRAPRALHHLVRPREADLALSGGIEPAGRHIGDVVGGMGQCQRRVVGARRLVQGQARHFTHHRVSQHAVLAHREAMAGRQRQDEVVGVESLHRGGSGGSGGKFPGSDGA
ncbi:hypothetical protein D3C72_1558570 [compost metagenome]